MGMPQWNIEKAIAIERQKLIDDAVGFLYSWVAWFCDWYYSQKLDQIIDVGKYRYHYNIG
jgi:hypothetical protein